MQNEIIGIVGRKGSGKSTAMHKLLSSVPRLILWDPLGEHKFCPNSLKTTEQLKHFFEWTRGRTRFAARFIAASDPVEAFNGFAELVYRRGWLICGIEEAPMISQPNWLPPGFDKLCRLGRHRAISIVWTAQRMSEVARRLTSATDRFVLFRHTEPADIDAIGKRCGIEIADKVSRLGRHEIVEWDVLSQQVLVETSEE